MATTSGRKATTKKAGKPKARQGKVAIMGYYSPELSKTLHHLKVDEGVSLQHLLGEAIDLLLVQRGHAPAGER